MSAGVKQLGRDDYHVQDTSGNAIFGASVAVYREGATVNGNQSGTTPLAVTVFHRGKIVSGDSVFINTTTGTTYSVTAVTATTVTLSGFAGTLSLTSGDRLTPSGSQPTLYSDDQGSNSTSNPVITSVTGRASAWIEYGAYDCVVSGAGIVTTAFTSQVMPTEAPSQVRHASAFPGSDAGQQIANAIADLPTDGGVVDARGLIGAQTISSNPFAGLSGKQGVLLLGSATYTTTAQIIIPTGWQVKGLGRARGFNVSIIKADASFPSATAVVRMGDPAELPSNSLGMLLEDVNIDCNNVTNSIGIYSNQMEEIGTISRVNIRNFAKYAVHIENNGATFAPSHFLIDNLEIIGVKAGTTTAVGIFLDECCSMRLSRITVNMGAAAANTAGVWIRNTTSKGTHVIENFNAEGVTDGLLISGAKANVNTVGFSHRGAPSGTSAIHLDSTAVGSHCFMGTYGLFTNVINNEATTPDEVVTGETAAITQGILSFYVQNGRASVIKTFYVNDQIVNNFVTTVFGDGTDNSFININGATAKARSIQFQTAGSNRWLVRANSDAETGSNAGSNFEVVARDDSGSSLITPIFVVRSTGVVRVNPSLALFDGVTAPSTAAGWAQIYVDTADGDLKVKFGDGVVKTIVVDT